MIGQRFGRLIALERVVVPISYKTKYLCQCDCGKTKYIRTDALKEGVTTSCGCYQKERTTKHGRTGSRLYKIWDAMKQRCFNPTCEAYSDYGGRTEGNPITVCIEWRSDFMVFYNWAMANGYQNHLTIERVNVNGNYEPGNCRWATRIEQSRNKRNTLDPSFIEIIRKDPRSHQKIADDYGVNQSTITRIKNGLRWSGFRDAPSEVNASNPHFGVMTASPTKDNGCMARIHDTITIDSGQAFPSLGSLLGSRVSTEVFNSINSQGHSSYFDGEFDHMRQEFFNRYVKPMDILSLDITNTVNAIMNPDQFRILDSINAFKSIPPCMEMAIAMYAPVRQGMIEGRFEGFGYIPSSIPDDDVYGRIIENFSCDDVAAASDENGYFPLSGTMYSDDPVFTNDELLAIERTRDYIRDHILRHTDRDPTAITLPRG